jgi:hypothetical protein
LLLQQGRDMATTNFKSLSGSEIEKELQFYYFEIGRMGRDPQRFIELIREAESELIERRIKAKVSHLEYEGSLRN